MYNSEKLTKILLECYIEAYKFIGVNFHEIDKKEDFFLDYELCDSEQEKIINRVINKHKLKSYERQCIKNSYWLGCSPASTKMTRNEKE
jgi:hypothetical protein